LQAVENSHARAAVHCDTAVHTGQCCLRIWASFWPVLSCFWDGLFAGILLIFLHGNEALQVSFQAKKETQHLDIIWSLNSAFYSALSRLASNLPGLSFLTG